MTAERCSMRAKAPDPTCVCGCGEVNLKIQLKTGHVVGCRCPSCIGRRNRRKGHAAQARAHKRLGGQGWTPTEESSARPYQVECLVMPEVKTGQQIPKSWDTFIKTEWFRRALSQSERAVPFGSGALPCVVLRGDFAVVDIRRKK
jgi:hypothetical protein